jgi:DNA-binding transcriptional LysR family regulator
MELYQIRTFLVVAQEQNLTRAAERLALSQPAVSGQIKSLEAEFGSPLFERGPTGMQLTTAGKALIEPAQALMSAASSLRAQADGLAGQLVGSLKLGVVLHPDAIGLGPLVRRLLERHPMVRLDIRHRNTLTIVSSLRSHELDASFYIGKDVPVDLGCVELRRIIHRVVASRAWAERLRDISWADLAQLPWIVTPKGGAFAQLVDSLFQPRGLQLAHRVEADQELSIISLVEAGVGVSLMRDEVAREAVARGAVMTWDGGSTESVLRLLYLRSRESEPLTRELIQIAGQLAAEIAPAAVDANDK